jgi:periplasmic divalent cation tolerance protein
MAGFSQAAGGISMKTRLCLAMTTVADRNQAERLAHTLVERRLAACVSLGAPITSVYPWAGQIESESEIPLSIKTAPDQLDALKTALAQLHPYDVPELLVLPVIDGLEPYFDWARDWMNDESN